MLPAGETRTNTLVTAMLGVTLSRYCCWHVECHGVLLTVLCRILEASEAEVLQGRAGDVAWCIDRRLLAHLFGPEQAPAGDGETHHGTLCG